MSYEMVKCEICGEMVSSFPSAFKRHQNACSKTKTPEVETKVETPVVEPNREKFVKDPRDAELIKRARAMQDSMLKTPNLNFSPDVVDQNKMLRRMYAPDTFDTKTRKATMTAYFGHHDMREIDVASGWEPVINEHGEHVMNKGGDYMYVQPSKLYNARKAQEASMSRGRLSKPTSGDRQTAGDVPQGRSGDVKIETMSVESGQDIDKVLEGD
jgi:hypothetical protein